MNLLSGPAASALGGSALLYGDFTDRLTASARQEQGQHVVVEHRNRDGEQASEEVPDDGFLGEPTIDVVQRNVDAVRPGDDGEDKELVILDRQPQPVFQEQHADKVFQQGNGQPCV